MSYGTGRLRAWRGRTAPARRVVTAVLFGDRLGLAVYLATLCLFGLVWRVDFLITDSYTLANGLYSLTNGKLVLTEAVYSQGLRTPGAEPVGDSLIARNYGAIVLSLPFWVLLEAVDATAQLSVALVGLWSLVALALAVQVGTLLDDQRVSQAGGVAVLAAFGVNVLLARPLDAPGTHLLALQLFHLTTAAFVPVLFYRLFERLETTTVGVATATLSVAGTPLAIWAVAPKRHAITATVVVGIAYALYRSRQPTDSGIVTDPTVFRAVAYALVGLYAWVHAPEALLLLVALAVVDLPTAADNGIRSLALIGTAFLLSLVPFALTNTLVVGSPLEPPRLLAVRGGGGVVSGGSSGGSASDGAAPDAGLVGPVAWLLGQLSTLLRPFLRLLEPLLILQGELALGWRIATEQPAQLYHTLVRSGSAASALNNAGEESVNLTVLEAAPLLAALAGGVAPVLKQVRGGISVRRVLAARRVVDLFAVVALVGLTLQYASRLPIHAQITVRYLFPVYFLGLYLVCRIPAVRAVLTDHWRTLCWTLTAGVFVGGQLLVVALHQTAAGRGEAFQLHALLALATAVPLALWAVAGRREGRVGQVGAALLGLATATTTLFVVLTAVVYYPLGDTHMIPMVRVLGELLALL